jgi:hypothetical protein
MSDHEFHNEACGCMPPPPEPVTVVLQDADLGSSKPISEPKPTRKQIGEWRAAHFTVKHSTVNACGHKLDLRHFPSNANCSDCWEAFFSVSPEGVSSVHQLLMTEGTQAVIRMHGQKFTRQFGRFLRKKLLSEYANREVPTSPSIEGGMLDIKAESEVPLGIR